jgi:hypothetical protein
MGISLRHKFELINNMLVSLPLWHISPLPYESKRALWPDRPCCYPWRFHQGDHPHQRLHLRTRRRRSLRSSTPLRERRLFQSPARHRRHHHRLGQTRSDGAAVLNRWIHFIRNSPKRCVDDDLPQVFDISGSSAPRASSPSGLSSRTPPSPASSPRGPRPAFPIPRDPFERTMAIHVRQGEHASDFCPTQLHLVRLESAPRAPRPILGHAILFSTFACPRPTGSSKKNTPVRETPTSPAGLHTAAI